MVMAETMRNKLGCHAVTVFTLNNTSKKCYGYWGQPEAGISMLLYSGNLQFTPQFCICLRHRSTKIIMLYLQSAEIHTLTLTEESSSHVEVSLLPDSAPGPSPSVMSPLGASELKKVEGRESIILCRLRLD